MKSGAKTKNWIINLLAILSVVFAFSVGTTYAYITLTNNYRSNMYSTATYMANQEYAIVNDTSTAGIAFGEGSRLFDVSIQYSYSYDFDIRFKYSISWTSSGLSTDNIILHYADRDNFIVDGSYIFYKKSISAGSGSLKIFAGADFVDPWDKTYNGQEFKITITDVVVYKTQTSYDITKSELTKTIQTSEAAKAWIWAKNSTSKTTAYAMVYNLRSTYENGVVHPNANGAYSRIYGSDKQVTSAQWLGGNRSYAGIGAYIITGKTAYTLTAKVTGAWINSEGATYSGTNQDSSAFIYINNIKFNYASSLTYKERESDNVFEIYTYKYTIPANTAVYIELVDGVEITCAANLSKADYSGYAVVASVYLNDTSFLADDFVDNLQVKELTTNGGVSGTTSYTTPTVTVVNTTTYDPALYNQYVGGEQVFYGNLSLINNTKNAITATISYKVNIFISNGHTTLFNTSDNSHATSFESNLWYRQDLLNKDALTSNYTLPSSVTLAPYASVNLAQRYEINISSFLADYGAYDAWVEIAPSVSTGNASTSKSLVIESRLVGSNYQVYVKNNTSATITGVNASVSAYTVTPTYETVDNKPLDWISNYWEYYNYNGSTYTQVTMVDNEEPTFDVATARKLTYKMGASSASLTRAAGISGTGTTYADTDAELKPGESLLLGTIAKPSGQAVYVFMASATDTQSMISGTSSSTTARVGLYHSGTSNAYIYNATTSLYYVKFDGKVTANEDITTINNVNYYVGVVRPGQIVKFAMTSKNTTFTSAVAGSTYSLPSGWGTAGDAVDTMYKNYFN